MHIYICIYIYDSGSSGLQVVFVDGFKNEAGDRMPLLVQKTGTQFTCFTRTKVHILPQKALVSQTAAAVCWRILTYAGVFWRILTYADVCWRILTYADVCWHVCWRILTYADVC